ncbi:hypothetical protein [Rhodohalobacter sulfatireducens]|uniref:Glycosyltransferase subfamily 4-like N-terminal domain-containing protein n=1 Tax=Rhodohalobacter sulfatireducens TaxID=2911366 RepID=A0ABS9KBF2_9BACT|nr:hypothetical protein [Rhodohalobacter sulfatireducens]MCG2588182.1 hypothetical protein [Rhodohalobacter sulfatireducens]
MINKLDVKCTVLGFEREHYEASPWDLDTTSLGRLTHARLLKRIPVMIRSIFKIRKEVKSHDVLYCFNLDILFIGWLSTIFKRKNIKIVYDLADIHKVLGGQGFLPSLFRTIERFLLERTDLVVVASPAYIEGYFRKVQNASNIFFPIENKMLPVDKSPSIEKKSFDSPKSGVLRIGYFGMIRCESSLKFLLHLLEKNKDDFELHLAGIFLLTESYKPHFEALENVSYSGPFVYPDDLPELYNKVDIIWAAHIHGETNTKWAISNRFYQGCFYKRPLITQKQTQDSKRVESYNIGTTLNLNDFDESEQILKSINKEKMDTWIENMRRLPKEVHTYTDEHTKLLEMIKSLHK